MGGGRGATKKLKNYHAKVSFEKTSSISSRNNKFWIYILIFGLFVDLIASNKRWHAWIDLAPHMTARKINQKVQ